ncbi:MAG TPA: aldo/keto reductase [Candidatus Binataceae bacterium]|nr:aldo/keto reductase [Candidatus Binataceae bacterium]
MSDRDRLSHLEDQMPDLAAPHPQSKTRALGKGGPQVSALGVGTNKWKQGTNDASVFETYRACQDGGITFFDTAEVYGFGKSERLLGECLRRDGRPATIATKFAPFFFRSSPRHLLKALDGSLKRLGVATIDLYFIHFPQFGDHLELADAMAEAVKAGKVRQVGVSNFSAAQMRRVADRLARANVQLAANQVHYSLLHRNPESNGVLEACREIGATLVAFFPLARAKLTAASGGTNSRQQALQDLLARVAAAHNATPGQVALNWLLARDPCVIPIPGASHAGNAKQNLGALDWTISAEEFTAIDVASTKGASS